MNRVFLDTGGRRTPEALRDALKAGRSFASNGPLLGLELDGKRPGDTVSRSAPGALALPGGAAFARRGRSPRAGAQRRGREDFRSTGDRRTFDAEGELPVDASGWILLRAWNDAADPLVLDLYPYATTSPVYLELPARRPAATAGCDVFRRPGSNG